MASQVLSWTIQLVRKLKPHRKPNRSKYKKVITVREASISRPSLRRPSDQYSQRRAEVEPLPYPAESSQAGRTTPTGTTHYYPHIYFQDGQYHTAHCPPLASAPTPPRSPNLLPQAGHPTAHQRSMTYPAGSPRSNRTDVWWADGSRSRPASPREAASGPRPGGGLVQPAARPLSPKPRMTAPPIMQSPPRRNATPGPSRIPPRNATPGPSRLVEPKLVEEPLPIVVAADPAAIDQKTKREKTRKSKHKQRAAEPPPRRDRIEFSPGRLPPAVQQFLYTQERARIQATKPLPEIPDYKPTAKFYLPNEAWVHYMVDPRFPPDDFPYETYLEMKKAKLARERRLRKREKEKEEKELALHPRKDNEASSRWPMTWIRRIFRSKRVAPLQGRKRY